MPRLGPQLQKKRVTIYFAHPLVVSSYASSFFLGNGRSRSVTIREFEAAVWRVEAIRIVLRAANDNRVTDYNYARAATQTDTINQWLQGRVYDKIGELEVAVIDGRGLEPHRGCALSTVGASYQP